MGEVMELPPPYLRMLVLSGTAYFTLSHKCRFR